ncbi:MAG: ABC transporter substrate-binding protein [Armatimonadota bacterium]|nr:ABC transporter substrate-binding protein [Armatimonadota bacterium]MDR7451842.1 ABC transporter substrate-binding protein [Armatimonadota bacterium]MDR7467567.1 ABC transporter substrate-binding protein [Armatimonadota bacterium]MDR7494472.1 ABC transporter substrate-binding protein [Armatimonadota bacterium]MDR7499733.1 ABC transporter substrate-binding protein [Armatimonadota bacterium]
MRWRRWTAACAVLMILTAALGAGGAAGPGPRVRIREAHTGTLFMAPVYIAEAAGYMAEEGIDLELIEVESGALGIAALVSGQVQFFDADPFQAVQLRRQGKQILFIYNLTKRVTLDMVMHPEVARARNVSRATPIAQRFAALRGLKLGITRPGAATDVYMRYYLKLAGLNPDRDAQLIAVGGGGALLAALRTRQIDAFHLSAPTPYLAEKDGFGVVVIKSSAGDVPQLDNFMYTGIAVHNVYANQNPDLLRRWVRAVNRANRLMRTDQAAAVQHLRKHFPRTDPEVLTLALREIIPALSEDGRISEAMMEKHLQFMLDDGQIPFKPSAKEGILWTNRFIGP